MIITIDISKDERKAFITLVPGKENEFDSITSEKLNDALTDAGISHGIKEDTIKHICKDAPFNKKYLIAEAIAPKKGENARIIVKIKQKLPSMLEKGIDKDKKVDNYGVKEGFITFVKKGEILATRIAPTRGISGFTITGINLEGFLGNDVKLDLVQGNYTEIDGNNLIAKIDGVFKRKDKKLHIEQVIELEHDLGLKTGSIILPLDSDIELIVPGDIKSGFTVQCNKITVIRTVEDAKITARNLEVKNGIVGTSDLPIHADYLTTNFITGTRIIKSRIINIKREISGGSTIHADYVRSQIIQECSVFAKYGVWTKFLYGKNNILVGVNIKENAEFQKLTQQNEDVETTLKEINISNHSLLKKADQVRSMAQRMPNNPAVHKELKKLNDAVGKIKMLKKIQSTLDDKLQQHVEKMYITGDPFILVELGFTKKLFCGRHKPLNNLTIKDYSYDKQLPQTTGLYSIKGEEVIVNATYNLTEINNQFEKHKSDRLSYVN